MEIIIWIGVGVLLGALAVWGWARARFAWLQAQASQQSAQVSRLEAEKAQLLSEKQQLSDQLRKQEAEIARLDVQLKEREAQHQEVLVQKAGLENQLGGLRQELETLREQYITSEERRKNTEQQLEEAKGKLEKVFSEAETLRGELMEEQRQRASAEAELRSSRASLAERDQMLAQLRTEFENLAGKVLEETQKRFHEHGAQSIQSLLELYGKDLKDLSNRIGTHQSSTDQLKGMVEQLSRQTGQISEEARKLAEALKGDVRVQGQLGEIVLERVLQWAQMQEGAHYRKQVSITGLLRPDFVVYLPNNRRIVIDSKISLKSYEEYFHAPPGKEKEKHAKAHVEAIRKHINDLSEKAYHKYPQVSTFDFVVMFVGIEGAFHLAVEQEPDILEEAIEKNVVLAAPSTLISILHIVHILHDMYKQSTSAQKIIENATKLYEKLHAFIQNLVQAGKALDKAREKYDEAWKHLSEGRGNVLKLAKKMREEGGLRTLKRLPEPVKGWEEDEEEESPGSSGSENTGVSGNGT